MIYNAEDINYSVLYRAPWHIRLKYLFSKKFSYTITGDTGVVRILVGINRNNTPYTLLIEGLELDPERAAMRKTPDTSNSGGSGSGFRGGHA